jgi:hypothetical protein
MTRNPASRLPYVVEKYRSAQMRQAVELEMVYES